MWDNNEYCRDKEQASVDSDVSESSPIGRPKCLQDQDWPPDPPRRLSRVITALMGGKAGGIKMRDPAVVKARKEDPDVHTLFAAMEQWEKGVATDGHGYFREVIRTRSERRTK